MTKSTKWMLVIFAVTFAFAVGTILADDNTFPTNGNVGIGTASPQQALHIAGNPNSITLMRSTAESGFRTARARGTLAAPANVQDGDLLGSWVVEAYSGSYIPSAAMEIRVDGAFTVGQRPPYRYSFFTAPAGTTPAERMRINSSGNIGIGTANPGERLEVQGNIKVNGNITSDGEICIGSGC